MHVIHCFQGWKHSSFPSPSRFKVVKVKRVMSTYMSKPRNFSVKNLLQNVGIWQHGTSIFQAISSAVVAELHFAHLSIKKSRRGWNNTLSSTAILDYTQLRVFFLFRYIKRHMWLLIIIQINTFHVKCYMSITEQKSRQTSFSVKKCRLWLCRIKFLFFCQLGAAQVLNTATMFYLLKRYYCDRVGYWHS